MIEGEATIEGTVFGGDSGVEAGDRREIHCSGVHERSLGEPDDEDEEEGELFEKRSCRKRFFRSSGKGIGTKLSRIHGSSSRESSKKGVGGVCGSLKWYMAREKALDVQGRVGV